MNAGPSPAPALQASAVVVALRGARVLDGVSVSVAAGEIVALVGPNGAGKSTLLAALAGDLPLESGAVLIGGEPLPQLSHRELGRRRAVLVQNPSVAFAYRAGEVIAMGRWPWSGTVREDEDEEAIAGAASDADVERLMSRDATELSGGETARVALARTLAQRAGIVMLDEPTAALDLGHQERVLGVARRAAGAGAAVLVVLHDLNLAAAYADRVVVLDRGVVVADGPPAAVLTGELLSAVYRHPVVVVAHPLTGDPLVLPRHADAEGIDEPDAGEQKI